MKKEKEKNPILYEKYKREHGLTKENDIDIADQKGTAEKIAKAIRHILTMLILVLMIGLSAVGVITLSSNELRETLITIIQSI